MVEKFGNNTFPEDIDKFLEMDDARILERMSAAADNSNSRGHRPAQLIAKRNHPRLVYMTNPNDLLANPEAPAYVAKKLQDEFGLENVIHDKVPAGSSVLTFPVAMGDGRIVDSGSLSAIMGEALIPATDYIFVSPSLKEKAQKFVKDNLQEMIKPQGEEE